MQGNLIAACACILHPCQKAWQGFWGHRWAAGHSHRYQTGCVQTGPAVKLLFCSAKLSSLWSLLQLRVAGGSEASCDISAKFYEKLIDMRKDTHRIITKKEKSENSITKLYRLAPGSSSFSPCQASEMLPEARVCASQETAGPASFCGEQLHPQPAA